MIPEQSTKNEKIIVKNLTFNYGLCQVLRNIHINFFENRITAITGASGQGKSTLLGVFNCMWDDITDVRCSGDVRIRIDGKWISPIEPIIPKSLLRQKVAMIFQEPNPLPMSIAKNMIFPLKLTGVKDKYIIEEKIHKALKQAFLWEEVKDRMKKSALELSGGQKQRLCIARALVLEPEILLCDEPTSSLDSKAVGIIEDLLLDLKSHCTILFVSHYIEQVKRIADQIMELRSQKLQINN